MGLPRHLHLRLGAELFGELRGFGRGNGLALSPAARLLLARALRNQPTSGVEGAGDVTALAALVAAEHAVLMVASVLPEGERRMRSMASRAAEAAEERLASLRSPVSEELT